CHGLQSFALYLARKVAAARRRAVEVHAWPGQRNPGKQPHGFVVPCQRGHSGGEPLDPLAPDWVRVPSRNCRCPAAPSTALAPQEFGKLPSGELVHKIHLDNGAMTADVLTYGANLVSVKVPSSASPEPREVTLNGTDLASVLELGSSTYMGAVAGRFANRIAGGTFSLDGETHVLARNNGTNHLHGGKVGFDKVRLASAFLPTRLPGTSSQRVWDIVGEPTSGSVSLRLVSPDGDEGYPGELTAVVTYSLSRTNELGIAFQASVAGRPTVLNLCNHAYWNLSGEAAAARGRAQDAGQFLGADDGGDGVADHTLWLGCRHFVETDEDLVPTGRVVPAEGAMDFSAAGGVALGPRVPQIISGANLKLPMRVRPERLLHPRPPQSRR
ncbi:GALM, partial [Symbiodinium sp. KB8]